MAKNVDFNLSTSIDSAGVVKGASEISSALDSAGAASQDLTAGLGGVGGESDKTKSDVGSLKGELENMTGAIQGATQDMYNLADAIRLATVELVLLAQGQNIDFDADEAIDQIERLNAVTAKASRASQNFNQNHQKSLEQLALEAETQQKLIERSFDLAELLANIFLLLRSPRKSLAFFFGKFAFKQTEKQLDEMRKSVEKVDESVGELNETTQQFALDTTKGLSNVVQGIEGLEETFKGIKFVGQFYTELNAMFEILLKITSLFSSMREAVRTAQQNVDTLKIASAQFRDYVFAIEGAQKATDELGGSTQAYEEAVDRASRQVEIFSGFVRKVAVESARSEAEIAETLTKFTALGASPELAARATLQAIQLVRAKGGELNTYVEALGQSLQGNRDLLAETGEFFGNLTDEALKAGGAVEVFEKRFGTTIQPLSTTSHLMDNITRNAQLLGEDIIQYVANAPFIVNTLKKVDDFFTYWRANSRRITDFITDTFNWLEVKLKVVTDYVGNFFGDFVDNTDIFLKRVEVWILRLLKYVLPVYTKAQYGWLGAAGTAVASRTFINPALKSASAELDALIEAQESGTMAIDSTKDAVTSRMDKGQNFFIDFSNTITDVARKGFARVDLLRLRTEELAKKSELYGWRVAQFIISGIAGFLSTIFTGNPLVGALAGGSLGALILEPFIAPVKKGLRDIRDAIDDEQKSIASKEAREKNEEAEAEARRNSPIAGIRDAQEGEDFLRGFSQRRKEEEKKDDEERKRQEAADKAAAAERAKRAAEEAKRQKEVANLLQGITEGFSTSLRDQERANKLTDITRDESFRQLQKSTGRELQAAVEAFSPEVNLDLNVPENVQESFISTFSSVYAEEVAPLLTDLNATNQALNKNALAFEELEKSSQKAINDESNRLIKDLFGRGKSLTKEEIDELRKGSDETVKELKNQAEISKRRLEIEKNDLLERRGEQQELVRSVGEKNTQEFNRTVTEIDRTRTEKERRQEEALRKEREQAAAAAKKRNDDINAIITNAVTTVGNALASFVSVDDLEKQQLDATKRLEIAQNNLLQATELGIAADSARGKELQAAVDSEKETLEQLQKDAAEARKLNAQTGEGVLQNFLTSNVGTASELLGATGPQGQLISLATQLTTQVANATEEQVEEMVKGLVDGAILFIDKLIDAVPKVIRAVQKALPQIIDALYEAIPTFVETLVQSVPLIIDTFVENVPKIVSALVEGIVTFRFARGIFAGLSSRSSKDAELAEAKRDFAERKKQREEQDKANREFLKEQQKNAEKTAKEADIGEKLSQFEQEKIDLMRQQLDAELQILAKTEEQTEAIKAERRDFLLTSGAFNPYANPNFTPQAPPNIQVALSLGQANLADIFLEYAESGYQARVLR